MAKRLLLPVCIFGLFLCFSCGKDKHPEYPTLHALPEQFPGLEYLATGQAFLSGEQIRYESGGVVYDSYHNGITDLKLAESGYDVSFTGTCDPEGRLMYAESANKEFPRLFLFGPESGKLESTVEVIPLSRLRRKAEEQRRSFELPEELRLRLEAAGCYLPRPDLPPDRKSYTMQMPDSDERNLETLREELREMYRFNENEVNNRKAFGKHLDSLQKAYETVISRYVTEHKAEAYSWTFPSYSKRYELECVVFPDKGFAFEKTRRMNIPRLQSLSTDPVPKWKKQKGISLRSQGSSYRVDFRFKLIVSMVPWIEMEHERFYYYELSVAGEKRHFKFHTPLEILDYRVSGNKIYFSLIDRDKYAYLFIYHTERGSAPQ